MSNKIEFENGSIIESIDNVGQTIRGKIRGAYIDMDKYELRDYITLRMYDEMKHCIGYEGKAKRGTYKYWRNYFCLNDNDITWDKLVEYGLATKFNRDLMVVYNLSFKGIEFIAYVEGINIKEEK